VPQRPSTDPPNVDRHHSPGTIDASTDLQGEATLVVVAARNEAGRIAATLGGIARAFPHAPVWVADDGSQDGTGEIARAAGARVVRSAPPAGKGGAVTLALREALRGADPATVVVLCDGDLGDSAAELWPLAREVRAGRGDVAVAAFRDRAGGGFGIALGFARWAIRRGCGLHTQAPLSGQRALLAATLAELLPLASGYGMEVGLTIDAARRGAHISELELELSHRTSARTPGGFRHRARQLLDSARAYAARRTRRVTLRRRGGTALR
jgi:glycosyltransferase involved in cell wall biosynthesis